MSPHETFCVSQVGHEKAALTENRTFASLYVDPLTQILAAMNPKDSFTVNQSSPKYACSVHEVCQDLT